MEDLTNACAFIVIFWWNLKEKIDGDCFVSSSYSMPLSLMERRNYSISLCEHGEFVCHQRSVGCS